MADLQGNAQGRRLPGGGGRIRLRDAQPPLGRQAAVARSRPGARLRGARDFRCGQVGDPGVVDVGGGRAVPNINGSVPCGLISQGSQRYNPHVYRLLGRCEHLPGWLTAALVLALLYLATLTPTAVAQDAYVADGGSNSVSVVNTKINRVVGRPIKVGGGPSAIAITPNGRTAYVANETLQEMSR